MSTSSTNPFVLPGMGQTGEQAANPLFASMEMMRQAFAGLSGAGGFTAGMPMTPPMNPEDLERKIAELKSVENWLKLNLSMLSSTIQGMEVQLATIATLRSFATSMGAQSPGGTEGPSALEVMLGLRPQSRTGEASAFTSAFTSPFSVPGTTQQPAAQATEPPQHPAKPQTPEVAADTTDAAAAIPAAAQAWWNMLQQQFGQVAAATAASMAGSDASAASKRAPKPAAGTTKPAAKKPAMKRPDGIRPAKAVKK
jgi:hypothetical protein